MIEVLLVDDQPLFRKGMRVLVDAEDDLSVVGESGDGDAALRDVTLLRPDVVLMDVRMPKADGITATGRILAQCPSSRVLILTTFDVDEYVFESLHAGASGFILKDAPPESVLSSIRAVARGDAVLAPTATRRVIDAFAHHEPRGTHERTERPAAAASLTEREYEVFRHVGRGLSNREIAAALCLSEHTVKVHVAHILAKLELRDRVHVVLLAARSGLVL